MTSTRGGRRRRTTPPTPRTRPWRSRAAKTTTATRRRTAASGSAAGSPVFTTPTGGAWATNTDLGPYGSSYAYSPGAVGTGGAPHTARFTPTLPEGGTFEVFMWWTASSANRAVNAPVTIATKSG